MRHCTAKDRNRLLEKSSLSQCRLCGGFCTGEKFARDDQTLNLSCTFVDLDEMASREHAFIV